MQLLPLLWLCLNLRMFAASLCVPQGQTSPTRLDNGQFKMIDIPPEQQTILEAAAFRKLLEHLSQRHDVQNIDLMNLAGFCRNCLSKWYRAAAEEQGIALSDPDAREIIYGMPYEEWKAKYQQ